MKLESLLKKKAKDRLLEEFGNTIHYSPIVDTGYGNIGEPDAICCCDGHYVAIEYKAEGDALTFAQRRKLASVDSTRGIALVVRDGDIEDLVQIFRSLRRCDVAVSDLIGRSRDEIYETDRQASKEASHG
jgi:hypothetical protein